MKIGLLFVMAALLSAADRDAAIWVLRNGGRVILESNPRVIDTLTDLPATDVKVVGVDLFGTSIAPSDLSHLSGLTELRDLWLPGPSFNPGAGSKLDANDELKALAPLHKLESLHFSLHFLTNINVQDKGLAYLSGLTGCVRCAWPKQKSKVRPRAIRQSRIPRPQLHAFRRQGNGIPERPDKTRRIWNCATLS